MATKEVMVQTGLRVPEALRVRLLDEAEKRGVSLNTEMIRRLEGSFNLNVQQKDFHQRVQALEARANRDSVTISMLASALASAMPTRVTIEKPSGYDKLEDIEKDLAFRQGYREPGTGGNRRERASAQTDELREDDPK